MKTKSPFLTLLALPVFCLNLCVTVGYCDNSNFTVKISEKEVEITSTSAKIYSDCSLETTLKYTNDAVEVVKFPVTSISPAEKLVIKDVDLQKKATKSSLTLQRVSDGLFVCNKPEFAMGIQIINPVDLPVP